jgi:hypothetical protein
MQYALFRKQGVLFGLVTASFVMTGPVVAADQDGNDQIIRPYANGAGPTAIFRFGRQEDQKRDVFAVVDPTLWRIQFFTLDDPSPDARSFQQRFNKTGDCLLPPTFRVWRVHQHENRVVLQSQPTVPVGALIYKEGAQPQPLLFRALSLSAAPADIARVATDKSTPDDKKPGASCSSITDVEQLPVFTASDASVTVTGGAKEVFFVSRIKPPRELGEFGRRRFSLAVQGRYLVSAQELEHGRSQGAPLRHFLVTTRTEVPGFVSTEVVLVRRSTAKALYGRMRINLGLSRVKMGHRNVAISNTGEVLVMGTFDKEQFRVHACQFKAKDTRCDIKDDEPDPVVVTQPVSAGPPKQAPPSPVSQSASLLWLQAFNYSEQSYIVDTGNLPDDCSRLRGADTTAPCVVKGGHPWAPLAELRLAKGSATRKGVPYAQNSGGDARPLFTTSDRIGTPIRKPLHDPNASPPFVFGDIENDGKTRSSKNIVVFGIDCSAFLSQLWGFREAFDTGDFRDHANTGTDPQIKRIGAINEAYIGDAFVIRIEHPVKGKDVPLLNHIVLYQDDRDSGPTDSSRAVFVVESSSACGGVCWSFYDESFFHGWGIITRDMSRRRPPNGMAPIPQRVDEWQKLFATFKPKFPASAAALTPAAGVALH